MSMSESWGAGQGLRPSGVWGELHPCFQLGDGLGWGLGAGPPEKRPESFHEDPEATEPLCPEARPRPGIMALGASGSALCPVLGAREGGTLQPISQSSLGEAVPGADRTTGVAWTLKTPSWALRVQNWGMGGGLGPGGHGGGRAEPRDQRLPGFLGGEAAEWSWSRLGCGWEVGGLQDPARG